MIMLVSRSNKFMLHVYIYMRNDCNHFFLVCINSTAHACTVPGVFSNNPFLKRPLEEGKVCSGSLRLECLRDRKASIEHISQISVAAHSGHPCHCWLNSFQGEEDFQLRVKIGRTLVGITVAHSHVVPQVTDEVARFFKFLQFLLVLFPHVVGALGVKGCQGKQCT